MKNVKRLNDCVQWLFSSFNFLAQLNYNSIFGAGIDMDYNKAKPSNEMVNFRLLLKVASIQKYFIMRKIIPTKNRYPCKLVQTSYD